MSRGSVDPDAATPDASAASTGEFVRTSRCRRCGAQYSSPDPNAVCPKCLMRCALEEALRPEEPAEGLGQPPRLPPQFGRYTLLKQIGSGAMGDVYLARDAQTNRQVAIKTPQLGRSTDPTMMARFRREAQLAAALSHPNICPVYDVGEVDGVLYYTMAYINGRPLTRWIDDPRPIPPRQVALLVRKLAAAMAQAHRHGIVHRDLKPSNVMIDQRREPIIMDFGLARHASFDSRLTQSNVVVGTPAYLAPELIGGGEDSPATDIYALGVVLYELLTKRLPFSGHLGELLAQITRDTPPPPSRWRSDVPAALDQICNRALAKDPAQRFSSMSEMADALSACLQSTPVESPPDTSPTPRHRFTSRHIAASLLAALALLATTIAITYRWRRGDGDTTATASSKAPFAGRLVTGSARATAGPDSQSAAGELQANPSSDANSEKRLSKPTSISAAAPDGESPTVVAPSRSVDRPPSTESGSSDATGPSSTSAKTDTVGAATALPTTDAPLAAANVTDKPRDVPKAQPSLADRCLAEMRRIDVERRRLLKELNTATGPMSDNLSSTKAQVVGDLAAVRRRGEDATRECQQIDNRLGVLNVQRTSANTNQRTIIDQEVDLLRQSRTVAASRLAGLEVEARGKLVELSKIEKEVSELRHTTERLVMDTQRLLDAVFWLADPSGSFGPPAYQELAKVYSEWLDYDSQQVEVLALRSIAWTNCGQFEWALRDTRRALAQQPKSSLAMAAQGYAKYSKGQASDGLADLNRAVRLAPQAPYAYFFRGLVQRGRKNDAAALEDFAKAAGLAPHSPWIRAQWALQLAAGHPERPGSSDQARELAEQACEATFRQSWLCLESLAASLSTARRFAEAAAVEQTAVDLAPLQFRAACLQRLELYRSGQVFSFER